MNLKIIVFGVIALISLIILLRMLPKDDNLHRNMRPGVVLFVLALAAAGFILSIFFAGKEIVHNGIGPMDTDYGKTSQSGIADSAGSPDSTGSPDSAGSATPGSTSADKNTADDNNSNSLAPDLKKSDNTTLVIVVSLDKINIDNKKYNSAADAKDKITKALEKGKAVRVIDDYAMAGTYTELIDMLLEMGISQNDIEEIKEP